ncbi:SDR family NAD(P)-dependent oxidoreductase [Tumebacillus permanentifrigoris]|uniref:Phosphopantetheine binding protein n=1 Tax=Tumebacillus permanentifrigoris TaxID=378543 RepID=A0A316D7H9_9BACL|nr:SDR family NAD(P)-dependent oxidoreductase [Tumebacillus permanentifrigoris]PWK05384.1 phosphopantetheine binding protein [Tumebacillus permanentifrigoris]
MKNILKYVVENVNTGKIEKQAAVEMIKMLKEEELNASGDIAVIGMSADFPLAETLEDYWEQIESGLESIRRFPTERQADIDNYMNYMAIPPEQVKYPEAAYLENIDRFDNAYFRISPKEASMMDPCQRIFMETVFRTIEDAGYGGQKIVGTETGIYVGYANHIKDSYSKMLYEVAEMDASAIVGNLPAVIPGRIAYALDLKGPSMVVDTACSSSLVSIALACRALRNRECEMAIAGGIRISTVPQSKEHEKLGIEASDGKTRAFDHLSDGAGVGEGVAAVMLKPLQQALRDGDHIHAVIKGVAVNQDGTSISMTAPNPMAQTEVIKKAWEDAQIDPETISYIVTHGTGTNLGDPIEIKGIQNAFRAYTDRTQFCAVASVKPNIGHLFEAAGIANFIQAVLALKNKKLPPSLNFNTPNRTIDFLRSPIYVNTQLRDWETEGHPRRCGVSSFGISGTNAHIVLEEAPPVKQAEAVSDQAHPQVLTLSAKSHAALSALVYSYKQWLGRTDSDLRLADVCATANTGRGHYNYRLALVADRVEDMLELLEHWDSEQEGVHYGYHKVVAKNREAVESFEMTEASLQALNAQANEQLQGWTQEHSHRADALVALCKLYVAGAQIEWGVLYEGAQTRKVRLPVYPFERLRHWVELPSREMQETAAEDFDLFYSTRWVPSELDAEAAVASGTGTVLIFADPTGLGDKLAAAYREQNRRCLFVELGDAYRKVGSDHYVITGVESDYDRLFQDVRDASLTQILHLFSKTEQLVGNRLSELESSQQRGLYSLFYLTRAMVRNSISQDLNVCLISEYAEEVSGQEAVLKPENAALYGLGKVVMLEYPNIHCRAIDLDDDVSVDTVLLELNAPPSKFYQVSYRQGVRYVEQFSEMELQDLPDHAFELREEGVYVLTGGAGGIGLEVAKHFASQKPVRMAFLNRSALPEREQWDALVEEGTNPKLAHKIRFIQEIEALGAQVECHAVDVADLDEMDRVLTHLRAKHGRINGVVHAAGVPGDGYLVLKEHSVFDDVVKPKMQGVFLLDHLTAEDDLDFFAIFSSGISIMGEVGQGDYVAANAYLDAYAAARNKRGKTTVTFDWTSWKTAGMSVEYGFNKDLLYKSILTEQALYGFDVGLRKQIPRLLVGELNAKSEYVILLEMMPCGLSPKLQNLVDQYKAKRGKRQEANEQKRSTVSRGEVRLTGKDGADYTEVEKVVARIYRETLGFDEINVHDSFFELGGDSVMLNKLHAQIEKEYPSKVKVTDLFAHTSITKLAQFIGVDDTAPKQKPRVERRTEVTDDDIAVIGLSVNMPMAGDADAFWTNLVNNLDCVTPFPAHRVQDVTDYLLYAEGERLEDIKFPLGCYLENNDKFDYKFFKLSPKEAQLTDPHQRMFMQTVWHAIEDAGYSGGKLAGSNTGVYVGFAGGFKDSYQRLIHGMEPEHFAVSAVGNINAMIPSRICYLLDLKGPAMVIDTACSSTLVALHNACRDLRNGDAEMAIVAGVRLALIPLDRDNMKIGIEASIGRTMSFDALADGSGLGEGSAAVIIKPLKQALADQDQVYAVIKGSALNQDGASMGITAPNPAAQEAVLIKAWQNANIDPESLSFIEAHGTATALGDPIEIDALHSAFQKYTDKTQFCAVGAVKSVVGHLYEAAGITSFVKSVLALQHRVIPPSMHFNQPNPKIDFTSSPIYVNTMARPYEGEGPMRCGVSSFGFSGTNCHIVLEEAPVPQVHERERTGLQVFTLTAKSEYSFRELQASYQAFLEKHPEARLADVCYTANTGRDHYPHRLAVIVRDGEQLLDKLRTPSQAGVFQGVHRVVSERQGAREEHAITERERSQLSAQAREKLAAFLASGQRDEVLLDDLCALYVQGADLDWDALYEDEPEHRISLPLYPFEPNRCWIEVPEGSKWITATSVQAEADKFFSIAWKQEPLVIAEQRQTSGPVLILMDERGIGAELANRYRTAGREAIEVAWGTEYRRLGENRFVISGAEADYVQLAADLQAVPFDQVLHLFSVRQQDQGEIATFDELEGSQERGVYSLFYFARALANSGVDRELDVVLIADNAAEVTKKESHLRPEHATLFGIGKVVVKEHPNLMCRSLDLDEHTSYEAIFAELGAVADTYQVAYRAGVRYVEQFTEVDVKSAEDRPLTIREDGVYVITGGAGGIGLEVAKWIAGQNRVNLVLINRTKMPERARWDEILTAGQDEFSIKKIRNVLDIEALGATVECASADVADYEQVRAVLEHVRATFGRIDGVVHGAGVGGAEGIVTRSHADFHAVFAPKVQGTWNLDDLTRADDLDFMVLFSSIATMFPMAGQSDYIAANGYLDAYGEYRNKRGQRTVVINWSTWRETGMSVSYNFNIDTLFKAILTQEAIGGLEMLLNKNVPRALIGEINYDSKIIFLLGKSSFRLSDKISTELAKRTASSKARGKKKQGSSSGEVILTGSENGEYAETEKCIARICQQTLGFDELNIYDNFFELGADSILLTRMHGLIDKEYPGVVAMTDIFEYTSIDKLAQYINGKQAGTDVEIIEPKENVEDALRSIFDNLENDSISLEEALDSLKDI